MKICEDDNSTYKTERPLQNNKILVALLSEHNLIKKGYRQISFHLGIVFAYTEICNISPLIDHERDKLDLMFWYWLNLVQ